MKAQEIADAVPILAEYDGFFGKYIDVPIPGNDPRKLPKAIKFNGQVFGLSGHNTDLGKAAYATGKKVGFTNV